MQIHVEAKLFIFLIAQLTSSLHGYSEILVFPLVPIEALITFPILQPFKFFSSTLQSSVI